MAPRRYAFDVPQGAEEVSGEGIVAAVRRRIAHGADWVKFYADYRWGPGEPSRATFGLDELKAGIAARARCRAQGRSARQHARGDAPCDPGRGRYDRARQRCHAGGVRADEGARHGAFCPTLAATDAITRYGGWNGTAPEPEAIRAKRGSYAAALKSGVTMCVGGDTKRLRAWHQCPRDRADGRLGHGAGRGALWTATAGNAAILGMSDRIGGLAPGRVADLVAVAGDPVREIGALDAVVMVMQGGRLVRGPGK